MEMKYENPFDFSIPSITICFKKERLINESRITEKDPHVASVIGFFKYENISEEEMEKKILDLFSAYVNDLTIKDQHNVTIESYKLLQICELDKPVGLNVTSKYINCDLLTSVVSFITFNDKCINLFSNSGLKHDFRLRRPNSVDYPIIKLQLKRSLLGKSFKLMLDMPGRRIKYGTSDWFILRPSQYNSANVWFQVIHRELLSEPYSTKCIDFRTKGFECRDHCVSNCKIKAHLRSTGN